MSDQPQKSQSQRTKPAGLAGATTVQAIILSAQSGLLKEVAAFFAVAGFIAAVSIYLPG